MAMRLFSAVLLLSVAFSGGVALAAPSVIKFSHVVAENTPKGQMANKFKALVEERLAGQITVKVYPNSQLFGDEQVLEAMLLGDVQMAAPALSKFQKYAESLELYDLPFLFDDMAAVDRFQSSPEGKKLLTAMENKGILGLAYLHNGMKQISSSRPLRVPEDARGLKFRIMTSDVLAAQFNALGAHPVKKPFSEVFPLLQTRALDGQENTWSNIYSQKFYEVQPFITETNHGVLDYLIVTSAEFWQGLPEDTRAGIEQALAQAIAFGNQIAKDKEVEDRQRIIESGRSQIIELTPAERGRWRKAMQPVWKQFEERIGRDLIDAAQAANQGSRGGRPDFPTNALSR